MGFYSTTALARKSCGNAYSSLGVVPVITEPTRDNNNNFRYRDHCVEPEAAALSDA